MLPDHLEENRRYLMELLAEIRRRHEEEMRPIIDQLVRIECLRPAPRIVVNHDLAEKIKQAEMDATKRPIPTVYCARGGGCAACQPSDTNPLGQCQRYNQNAYPGKA